jgi:large subunit ribosomal protein L22
MSDGNTKSAKAIAKLLRTSPRKLNLVAAMIRNMKVDQALVQLTVL